MKEQCDVKIYSLTTCIHCRDMKEFLNQCGIAYKCINVDVLAPEERKQVLAELKELSPECAFPTMVVGDNVVVGLKKEEIKEILGIK